MSDEVILAEVNDCRSPLLTKVCREKPLKSGQSINNILAGWLLGHRFLILLGAVTQIAALPL